MSILFHAADALLAALGLFILRRLLRRLSRAATASPLPPGPPAKPLIGNLLDVPTGRAWLGWTEQALRFGPMSHLTVFGTHIVALHDPAAAAALFEKRSAVFSDRPRIVFGGEMCGWENTLALQRYGDAFRLFRRELHQIIGTPSSIARFHPLIEVESRRFLLRVLNDTSKLQKHVHTSTGAIILRMAYGYTMDPSGRDPLHALADKGISQISMAAQPGAFIVDVLPFLRHLPTWFPGARSFHSTAKYFKETVTELVEKPFAFVKMQVASGVAEPSYVSALLEKYDKEGTGVLTPEQEHAIKWSASSLYTGGADTTVSAIQAFFLAMLLHPHVLERAQAEVDSVTRGIRLPGFADRESLPYINALCKEVLRWAPVAPMGLPHVNSEDIVYEGYTVPKGSVVMPNIWHYAHDPFVYDSPYEFRPERFLSSSPSSSTPPSPTFAGAKTSSYARHAATNCAERDVREYVFGFGRRACPGRELADATLFMFVAMSVAALNIRPSSGKESDLANINVAEGKGWVAGTITHPEPFSVDARPRSPAVAAHIRAVEVEHPWTDHDAECLLHLNWKARA
ncbi:cytochrome P450 oxidoreductase [Fomitiporia mediterranea MF3/22]|uniref:cytochrome P450 oxidoreductase n=1 Tax=Fomitiporia mediterranea (strain MF3/22) TaxID=694068 RepID=UPI0004409127|nr:cytochrome P450 oxidoreductase [Fomitiporia mediterranea MF3/22]EJD06297.1 cytochrome P450 oxidoreductase [Fomitiporia mediterranea MF3/22]